MPKFSIPQKKKPGFMVAIGIGGPKRPPRPGDEPPAEEEKGPIEPTPDIGEEGEPGAEPQKDFSSHKGVLDWIDKTTADISEMQNQYGEPDSDLSGLLDGAGSSKGEALSKVQSALENLRRVCEREAKTSAPAAEGAGNTGAAPY